VTVLAIDSLPRTLSRAQKMDALTSMAGVCGLPRRDRGGQRLRPLLQRPDHGRRQGAAGQGVHCRRWRAGLAAIGTAANLGAIVRANDTRAEVADQVKSLGGEFVKVDYEEEGSGGGGYAKVMSEGFQAAQRAMYAQQARRPTSSSPPR
jgi:NAD(P) transhydrogenase subunit alpha